MSDDVVFVMSGASTKIGIHVGAAKAVEDAGLTVKAVYGTSSGAIVAACLACGYTSEEMTRIVYETNFKKFIKRSFFEYLVNLFFKSGVVAGIYKLKFLKALYRGKTFNDLETDLYIIGHSLTKSSWTVFSKRNFPDMPIATAVQISTTIPILFQAVEYNLQNGTDWFVDGGVSKDFPVDLVSGHSYIGHLIESSSPYIWSKLTVYRMFEVAFKQLVQSNVEESIIRANKGGLVVRSVYDKSLIDFDVSQEEKTKMLSLGYDNMKYGLDYWLKKKKSL